MLALCDLRKFCQRVRDVRGVDAHAYRGLLAAFQGALVGRPQCLGFVHRRVQIGVQSCRQRALQWLAIGCANTDWEISNNRSLGFFEQLKS